MSPRPTALHAAKVSRLNIYGVYFWVYAASNFSSFISSFQYFSDSRALFSWGCFCFFFNLFAANIFASCLSSLEIYTFPFWLWQFWFLLLCTFPYIFVPYISVLFLPFYWFMLTFSIFLFWTHFHSLHFSFPHFSCPSPHSRSASVIMYSVNCLRRDGDSEKSVADLYFGSTRACKNHSYPTHSHPVTHFHAASHMGLGEEKSIRERM